MILGLLASFFILARARNETHTLLKKYCASKGKFLSDAGDRIIKSFLETQHDLIYSEGDMIIEEEKPRCMRALKEIDIVRKGNRYIVRKRRS